MLDPPGAGVTGSCKPPNMGVGAELKSSMQEQSVFKPLSHFSIPHFFFFFFLFETGLTIFKTGFVLAMQTRLVLLPLSFECYD